MTVLDLARNYFDHEVGLTDTLVSLLDDSLDKADFILEAENAFGIDLPDDDLVRFVTLQDIQDYIDSRRPAN